MIKAAMAAGLPAISGMARVLTLCALAISGVLVAGSAFGANQAPPYPAQTGTPREVVSTLNTRLNEVLRDKELLARFDREGVVPTGGTPAYFDRRIRDEYAKWLAVVDRAKIKPGTD